MLIKKRPLMLLFLKEQVTMDNIIFLGNLISPIDGINEEDFKYRVFIIKVKF